MNCHRNYPWYRDWIGSIPPADLSVIGIHTPETARERELAALTERIRSDRLEFPVIADNDHSNWNAWGNSMWPSVYVVDKEGYLRYWWYGELDWKGAGRQKTMKRLIQQLIAE